MAPSSSSPKRTRLESGEGEAVGPGPSESALTEMAWKATSMRWTTAHAMTLRCAETKRNALDLASWAGVSDVEESSVSMVSNMSFSCVVEERHYQLMDRVEGRPSLLTFRRTDASATG